MSIIKWLYVVLKVLTCLMEEDSLLQGKFHDMYFSFINYFHLTFVFYVLCVTRLCHHVITFLS